MASPSMMMRPQIILLKEGTDTSQGKGQLLSNINACLAIVDTVRTTLGPRGMDKLIVDDKGKATISNDGATIMKLLDIVHPAAKSLVDIARAQDAQAGDGTTSVVLLAGELLKEVRSLIEDNMSPRLIIQGFRLASQLAMDKVKSLAVSIAREDAASFRELLEKCAATSMNSKLIHSQKDFFKRLVVDAILRLDGTDVNERLIAMKKIPGGGLQDTQLIAGVAFKKTFSYAGFEQQPKRIEEPKILCLNVELELKAERDNAEIRVERVEEYAAVVAAEWHLFYERLDSIAATGANVVLSKLPIGDLATQYFADRGIFCAGRVPADDLGRVAMATGCMIQSSVHDLQLGERAGILGRAALFEERQVGGERYNFLTGCPESKTSTFLLRGGSLQFIAEVERSLHDALLVVKRALQHQEIVGGGGSIEMAISVSLREVARGIQGKQQLVLLAFARALEVIPRQLADNAGLDALHMLNALRKAHVMQVKNNQPVSWLGVNVLQGDVGDMMEAFVWEPVTMKVNLLGAATEAATLILSIDETIKAAPQPKQQ